MAILATAFAATPATVAAAPDAAAPATTSAAAPIYARPVQPMAAGGTAPTTGATLASYAGKALLVVNVASKCGFTRQYAGLEALHRKYKDQGLVVVGFPSNDFMGQEPGTEEEIVKFCKIKYDITFQLYAKVAVKGAAKSPLYKYLTEGDHAAKAEVSWNFNKYLIGRDGKPVAHFGSKVEPDSPELAAAIEKALAAK